jgi:hypothetical protein
MTKVNFPRVILGGLLAGIVINVSEFLLHQAVMKEQEVETLKALGRPMPQGGGVILVWVLWGFALGITAVWLYAAIRPRYGAGAGTAVRAGLAAWFLSYLLMTVAMTNIGLLPFSPLEFVWNLVQDLVATLVGAWVYRETSGASLTQPSA